MITWGESKNYLIKPEQFWLVFLIWYKDRKLVLFFLLLFQGEWVFDFYLTHVILYYFVESMIRQRQLNIIPSKIKIDK